MARWASTAAPRASTVRKAASGNGAKVARGKGDDGPPSQGNIAGRRTGSPARQAAGAALPGTVIPPEWHDASDHYGEREQLWILLLRQRAADPGRGVRILYPPPGARGSRQRHRCPGAGLP